MKFTAKEMQTRTTSRSSIGPVANHQHCFEFTNIIHLKKKMVQTYKIAGREFGSHVVRFPTGRIMGLDFDVKTLTALIFAARIGYSRCYRTRYMGIYKRQKGPATGTSLWHK